MGLVDVAADIGKRLVESAQWRDNQCTWWSNAALSPASRGAEPHLIDGSLYGGTSGIALFLTNLFIHQPFPRLEETICGALDFALAPSSGPSRSRVGLYDGVTGIAYAAAFISERLQISEYQGIAAKLTREIRTAEPSAVGEDIISGLAGMVLGALRTGQLLGKDAALSHACSLADELLMRARKEIDGWSWDTERLALSRNFTGYAHGASGVAAALLAVYERTRETKYLYGATQAVAYEDAFFVASAGTWSLERNYALATFEETGRLGELVEKVMAGEVVLSSPSSLSHKWCYGSPGMLPVRVRLAELSGDYGGASKVPIAIESTYELMCHEPTYSLCHGSVGNAEALRWTARAQRNDELTSRIDNWSADIEKWYWLDRGSWFSGIEGGGPEPSLMLGEAGLGHFCLRSVVPSVPCVMFWHEEPPAVVEPPRTAWTRPFDEDYARTYFSQTIDAFSALGRVDLVESAMSMDGSLSPPRRLHRQALAICASENDAELRELLFDAFLLDRTMFELEDTIGEFASERLEWLTRQSRLEDWKSETIVTGELTRLVAPRCDWFTWLSAPPHDRGALPKSSGLTWLLYRKRSRIVAKATDEVIVQLVDAFRTPNTLERFLAEIELPSSDEMTDESIRVGLGLTVKTLYMKGVLIPVLAATLALRAAARHPATNGSEHE